MTFAIGWFYMDALSAMRKPKCDICCMRTFCKFAKETVVEAAKEGKK